MNDFDNKANNWDKNITHSMRAKEIAAHIKMKVPLHPSMKAMELGAGTALLSFELKDEFASITLIDTSTEMLRICNEKIEATGAKHIHTLHLDLEKEDHHNKYDLVYSQMAFHHINDIEGTVKKIFGMLNAGGYLAVADLYSEDGSFHGEGFTGYNGFDPDWMSDILSKSGFSNLSYGTCYVQKMGVEEGNIREYPIFLLIGQKI